MLAEVEEIVTTHSLDTYQKGIDAFFKKIDDKWGIKFFAYESLRDRTYTLQEWACEIDCAPKVGDKFEFTTPEGYKVYGYTTEIAELISKNIHGYPDSPDWCSDNIPGYDHLKESLTSIMEVEDLHSGNIGYVDGKLVANEDDHERPSSDWRWNYT